MKIRKGFVSNSSSSSYIIATNNSKITLTFQLDLEEFADKIFDDEESLHNYFLEEYGWSETPTFESLIEKDEEVREKYEKCVKAFAAGKKVFMCTLSSDGELIEQALYNMGFPESEDYEIIEGA